MTRDTFNVKTTKDTVAFLRSMYNFKSVVRDADAKWDRGKNALCRDLYDTVRDLPDIANGNSQSKERLVCRNTH